MSWPFKTAAIAFVRKDSVKLLSVFQCSNPINISSKNYQEYAYIRNK